MTLLPADPHRILVWLHVILAIYWLGPDWGVYVTSGYVVRPDLPVAERRRFLQAALALLWAAFAAWLLLSWRVHFGARGALTERLRSIDWNIRNPGTSMPLWGGEAPCIRHAATKVLTYYI